MKLRSSLMIATPFGCQPLEDASLAERHVDRLEEAELRQRQRRAMSRASRRERHLAAKPSAPRFGDLCAPGTPMRMIAHDPSWCLNQPR